MASRGNSYRNFRGGRPSRCPTTDSDLPAIKKRRTSSSISDSCAERCRRIGNVPVRPRRRVDEDDFADASSVSDADSGSAGDWQRRCDNSNQWFVRRARAALVVAREAAAAITGTRDASTQTDTPAAPAPPTQTTLKVEPQQPVLGVADPAMAAGPHDPWTIR
ncbi:hypothetical protein ACOMHN_063183 [Nucella lapillus]